MIEIQCTEEGKPLSEIPAGYRVLKNGTTLECYSSEENSAYDNRYTELFVDANEVIKATIRARVQQSISFGKQLIEDFTVENTMLGIAQSSPSVAASLMINTESIMKALETGSLYVAIAGIKALPVEAFDGVYLTAARALDFRNKIHVFLNLPTVQTYNQ